MMSAMDPSMSKEQLDDQSYGYMQSAVALISQGSWKDAASALEKGASLHARAGRSYDEARCLQLAATLQRSAGEAGKSRELIDEASRVPQSDEMLKVSIVTEHAETALAEGRYQDAVADWTAALGTAKSAGLNEEGLSAMLRRRAAASVALGHIDDVIKDYEEAWQLSASSKGAEIAHFIRLEEATVLCEHGAIDKAERILTSMESEFTNHPAGPHVMADLFSLRARMACAAGQPGIAADLARRSRDAALKAVAPVSYFAASVELGEALATTGDMSGAYGTLATAWVTLSDLLGK